MTFPLNDAITKSFPTVFDRGVLNDAVTVIFGQTGIVYDGWSEVRITKSLETMTDSFGISMIDKWRPENSTEGQLGSSTGAAGNQERIWPFQPGQPVHIKIGTTPVLSGYIDKVDVSFSNSDRTVTIEGRDKTGDLVDSSAFIIDQATSSLEFKNIDIVALAKKFTTQLDIKVSVAAGVDIGEKFEKFTVKQGESIFEMLERAAKLRGLLMLSDDSGDLVFTNRSGGDIGDDPDAKTASTTTGLVQEVKAALNKPSIQQPKKAFDYNTKPFKKLADVALIQGENILEARATYDMTDRFQTYVVKGQQPTSDTLKELNSTAIKALSFDRFVTRKRTKVIIPTNSVDATSAKQRANWEAIVRATKAVDIVVKLQGWEQQPGGRLWQVNELVKLEAGMIGVKGQTLLITGVEFEKSTDGTFTIIKMTRPDAYDVTKDTLEIDSDPSKDLGHKTPGLESLADQAKQVLNKFKG